MCEMPGNQRGESLEWDGAHLLASNNTMLYFLNGSTCTQECPPIDLAPLIGAGPGALAWSGEERYALFRDHIQVLRASDRAVSIEAPVPGYSAVRGCVLRVRWTAACNPNPDWKFFLNRQGIFHRQLFLNPVNDSAGRWHADWVVDSDLPVGECQWDLVVKDDTTVTDDHSGDFCILAAIPGDIDGDGDVDLGDLATLLANFGRVCQAP